MSAIGAIAGVQARIGTIEQRLGIARSATTAAPAASATVGGATATRATTTGAIDLTGGSFEAIAASIEAAVQSATSYLGTGSTALVATGAPPVAPDAVSTNGELDPTTPYAELFEAAGARYGIDPQVLAGVAEVESRFQTDVVSSAGAVGMMQFLPATAAALGVNPHDPASAVDGAARYLRSQVDRFGSIELALAAYNVGPGAVADAGGIQPGSQAERYVGAVLAASERV